MRRFPEYAWLNGAIVPWEDARVHVRTEAFMRGATVFEGVRAYRSHDNQQLYVFRNEEHLDRLFGTSMKILRMNMIWSREEIANATLEVLRANGFRNDLQVRPTVYFGMGEDFGFDADKIECGCVITAIEQEAKPTLWSGIHVCVSSWRRIDDEAFPPRVKAGANYLNSRHALVEAKLNGYDSAILLNHQGKVSEGAVACVVMVRHNQVVTPPVTADILESVTRSTLIQLFREELGMEVVERELDRTELYIADELAFCATGTEVQPIISVDRYPVGSGSPGPVISRMQELYFGIVRGQNPKYGEWLTPVY